MVRRPYPVFLTAAMLCALAGCGAAPADPNAAATYPPEFPYSLTFDADGELYALSAMKGVFKRQSDGTFVQFIANDDQRISGASKIRFVSGSFFIFGNDYAVRYDSAGEFQNTVFDPNDLDRLGALWTTDFAVDSQGRVYVSLDYPAGVEDTVVYRYDADGANETAIIDYDEGSVIIGEFLAIGPDDSLYAADPFSVHKFDANGNFVAMVVEQPEHGLDRTGGLAVNSDGQVYVWNADQTADGVNRSSLMQFNAAGEYQDNALEAQAIFDAQVGGIVWDLVPDPQNRLYHIDAYGNIYRIVNGQFEMVADFPEFDTKQIAEPAEQWVE